MSEISCCTSWLDSLESLDTAPRARAFAPSLTVSPAAIATLAPIGPIAWEEEEEEDDDFVDDDDDLDIGDDEDEDIFEDDDEEFDEDEEEFEDE